MTTADKIELGQGNPLFTTQFRALSEGIAGNGILAAGDLAVSADPDTALGLVVDAGGLRYDGSDYQLGVQASLTLSAGDADHDRWDTVVFDTAAGAPAVLEGTAEANPTPPDTGAGEFLLAVVYVPATASDFADDDVLNARATHQGAGSVRVADAPDNYTADNVEGALAELAPENPAAVSGDYTTAGESVILVDTSAGAHTITLASADASGGNGVQVIDAAGNARTDAITIATESSETIDGAETQMIESNWSGLSVISNGSDWFTSGGGTGAGGAGAVTNAYVGYGDSPYTVTDEDVIRADSVGEPVTLTLSVDAAYNGNQITILDLGERAGTNSITIEADVGTFVSGTPYTIDIGGASVQLAFAGGGWFVISEYRPSSGQFTVEDSGGIAVGDASPIYQTELAGYQTLSVSNAALTLADGQAAPTGLELAIATLDNSGGGNVQATVVSGDGSAIYNRVTGDPIASYYNDGGGVQTVTVLVDNGHFEEGSGRVQNVYAATEGKIP